MREFTFQENVERSLLKKFKGPIYGKFLRAIEDYSLIEPNDKIAVALSGGKDSLLMAKLFQEAKRHSGIDFDLVFIAMNPGFQQPNQQLFLDNCEKLGIDVVVEESNIFELVETIAPEGPCFMCARMRRGFLYQFARNHGCNKLALGHHFDDVIETTLLNIFYTGTFKTMMPKAKSENHPGMELIRPMYYIKENDIIRFTNYHQLKTMNCGCKVTRNELDSKRKVIKLMIKELKKEHKDIDLCIFRSAENVNLHNVLGYYNKDLGIDRTFLDDY